jgi:hypothetical protein
MAAMTLEAYSNMAVDMNNLEQFTVQGANYFRDPNSGDVYSSETQMPFGEFGQPLENISVPTQLFAKGSDVNNPDFANLTQSYNWRGINNAGEKYTDPAYAVSLSNLKQQNPDQYYKTLATDISDQILGNWSMNKNEHNAALTNQLESIKDVNPAAYYQAQLNLLSKQSGWQHGQNTFDKAKPYQEKMTEIAPKALEAGLSPEQIDSIVGQGFSAASSQNQQFIANRAASGGGGFSLSELLRGVAPVAAFAIGAPFLDAALAGTAAAGSAASGAGGSIGGINLGGAFVPTAGSGASFTLPAAAGAGGSIGGINLGGAFTPTAGSGASFTVPSAAGGLMGPTYAELGVTGVEGGLAGPTYAELGYTGLNNAEAIAAADAAAKAASTGISAKNVLSGANQAQKLAKLLTQGGSQVGRNMGVGSMPIANQIAPQPLFEQFGGLYRMNQNPFSFGTQGQTVASPNMFDVSGSNPMANALRKS